MERFFDVNSQNQLTRAKETAFSEFCLRKINLLVKQVILRAQRCKGDEMLSGDQTLFNNLWDEYCVQIQDEEWFGFDFQEHVIEGFCLQQLAQNKKSDPDTFKMLEVYLSEFVCEGYDWGFNLTGELDLAEVLKKKFVDPAAMEYTNSRIRYFHDHNYHD